MNKERFFTRFYVVWIGALLCCALWGSAFPCIKIGYRLFDIASGDTATQILFAGMRFTIAGILAIAFGSALGHKLLYPKVDALGKVFKLCMFQTVGQYICFYIGLAHTTGVKASIIEGVNVFAAIFVSCVLYRIEKLTSAKIVGSIVGFAGVVLINIVGATEGLSFNISGDGMIFMSAIMYAFSSVFIKKYSASENPVMLSGYQFLMGGVILVIIGAISGGHISQLTGSGVAMLLYLAFVSAFSYSLWSVLLKYNQVSKVAVFGFANPVFGVILSALLLSESDSLNVSCLLSLLLVCIGIYITNKKWGKTDEC